MSLLLRTHYQLAKANLRRSKHRTFLTCLGIAIGVAAIILILSLMGSISNLVRSEVNNIGGDLIVVRPTTHQSEIDGIVSELTTSTRYIQSSLTIKDVDSIKKLDDVQSVAPLAVSVNTIQSDENHTIGSATIVGTNSDLQSILNLTLDSGSFLSTNFTQDVAVIGHNLAMNLYGTDDAVIGKTFTTLGQKFMVIGVLNTLNNPINFNNIDFDETPCRFDVIEVKNDNGKNDINQVEDAFGRTNPF